MMQKIGLIFFTMGLLLAGCTKKDLLYKNYGGPVSSGSTLNSNIRLVSLCTGPILGLGSNFPSTNLYIDHRIWELRLNGRSMGGNGIGDTTTFSIGSPYPNASATNPFPNKYNNGYTIPDSSLGSDGRAHIQVNYLFSLYQQGHHISDSVIEAIDTSLNNNAQDLYLYNDSFAVFDPNNNYNHFSAGTLHIKAFPRAVSVSDPSKFKIRVINLAHAAPYSFTGGGDPLFLPGGGSVSLTGSAYQAISPSISQILPGQASDYIELPYGTYQFRILCETNRQIPFLPALPAASQNGLSYFFTSNGDVLNQDNYVGQTMAYEPIRTYLPGGIYTIVVYDGLGQPSAYSSFESPYLQSGYKIIQDNTPPSNVTYSNIQWVNALPGQKQVGLAIDGNTLGLLDFGQAGPYKVFTAGQHTVTLQDAGGQTLVSQSFQLQAMNNYSIWAYMDQANNPQIRFVSNEMDMTNGGLVASSDYNFAARFLNFCPDAEWITFTTSNEQPFSFDTNPQSIYPIGTGPWDPSHQNIAFGVPRIDTSYLIFPNPISGDNGLNGHFGGPFKQYNLFTLNAFISEEDPKVVLPGTPIPSLPILKNPFIIDTTRYPQTLYTPYSQSPNVDAGIFTAALIGRINTSDITQQVRLIVVKHVQ